MTRLAKGTNQPPAAQPGDQTIPRSPSAGRLRNVRCIHTGTAIAAPTRPSSCTTRATNEGSATLRSATLRPGAVASVVIRLRVTMGRPRAAAADASANIATAAAAWPSGGAYGRAHGGPKTVIAIHCRPSQYHRPSGVYWPPGASGCTADGSVSGGGG